MLSSHLSLFLVHLIYLIYQSISSSYLIIYCLSYLATYLIKSYLFVLSISVGKYLLMLQSLKRAFIIDPDNPQLHVYLIHYLMLREYITTITLQLIN